MSFDFSPNVNLSNVQKSAKSCAGGGGNTGYFQRGKSDEEDENALLEFAPDTFQKDSFEYCEKKEDETELFFDSIKKFFKKLFKKIKAYFVK